MISRQEGDVQDANPVHVSRFASALDDGIADNAISSDPLEDRGDEVNVRSIKLSRHRIAECAPFLCCAFSRRLSHRVEPRNRQFFAGGR